MIFFQLFHANFKRINPVMTKQKFSIVIMSISWMLMPWLLAWPGHQHQWHWLGRSFSSTTVDHMCLIYWTVCSSADQKKTSKLRVTGLCEGNSLVTGEFPTQRPVMRKMFPFDDIIMPWGTASTTCTIQCWKIIKISLYFPNSYDKFITTHRWQMMK